MTTPYLIFDIVILLILAVFALLGAKRGLLLSLCGLLAVLVAFIGASAVSDIMAPKVAAYLEPKFAAALEQRLEEQIQSASWQSDGSAGAAGAVTPDDPPLQDVLNVLKDMGFYQSAVDAVDEAVRAGMTEVAASAAAAVAASIAGSVAHMLIFGLSFVLILILWTILSRALDLVARLPGLHALNKTGGALLGLVKGCILLFVCAWVLRYLGNIIPEEAVDQTRLLKFFMTTNPVTLILGA